MSQKNQVLSICMVFVDVCLIAISLHLSKRLIADPSSLMGNQASITLFVAIIWVALLSLRSFYEIGRFHPFIVELRRIFISSIHATLLFAGLLYFTRYELRFGEFITFITMTTTALIVGRYLLRVILINPLHKKNKKRTLIVSSKEKGEHIARTFAEEAQYGIELIGFIDHEPEESIRPVSRPVLGTLEEIRQIVRKRQIDHVVIALPSQSYHQLNHIVGSLRDESVAIHVSPDYFNLSLAQSNLQSFGSLPFLSIKKTPLTAWQRLQKRLFDIFVTMCLLIPALPVMAIVAIAIKLDSKGPIFFRQLRVGENGKLFSILKFRSMIPHAEKMQKGVNQNHNGILIHKKENDPRVTRVGRFIRRTSLDELPQLLNILWGDMSLVGPRPEMPWLVEQYQSWQHTRFSVPQGLTGWWQVHGRSNKPLHLNIEEDLYYIQNYSFWLDLYILLRTPLAVIRGEGAF